ncbi:hypothetical protein [Rubinisphaera sp. JC750]|uniref:hypothetical protein n=1 Tax=Rubinisphaera sp. JC750 TaxID=2898658 RepID=UPI001F3EFE2F|nr:hypothetical protein [Rubinisphaera sp. JC750]
MTRNEVAMLTAGLLMGAGAGLAIARSLPPAKSAIAASNSQVEEGSAALQHQSRLFDPEETPALPTGFGSHRSNSDDQSQNDPVAPRLLPEGEAIPVEPAPEPVTKTDAEESDTTLSAFRKELQGLAPEFNEKQLKELEQIRSQIESDMPDFDVELESAPEETTSGPDEEPLRKDSP